MRLLSFKTAGGYGLGIKTAAGVLDVGGAKAQLGYGLAPVTMEALLAQGRAGRLRLGELLEAASGRPDLFLREEDLELGPAVPNPGKIICVGLNYRPHAEESAMQVPQSPILFSKFNNALAAHGERIPLPANAVEYDYEAELVAVIGRRTRYVAATEALDCVFGYCNGNDLSARDLQFRTNQWLLGKTPDKFMPIGPHVVTADEVGDPQKLGIRLAVNGEQRQNSTAASMIFDVAYLVSYISQYMTLEPGDLISTGTPEGVILGTKERVWLKPGDEVTVEIEGLGRLTNRLVAEER